MKDIKKCSIYIHIPFCIKKCNYCDFLSFTSNDEEIDLYIDVLLKEIENYGKILKNKKIISIFIGGGTPSILNEKQIANIMEKSFKAFDIDKNAEITIECNPGTLTYNKVKMYKSIGINRISIGLQSTNNQQLYTLGRLHSYEEFEKNYYLFRTIGFNNINIDLMFGLPNQNLKSWVKTLKMINKLKPEHISAYSLTIENGTKFYSLYNKNLLTLPNEDKEREMYWYTHNYLTEYGYNHYEISNYSLLGFNCIHNKVYWTLKEYVGIGLGASSYLNHYRIENTRNITEYIDSKGDIEKIQESIHLSSILEQKEEFIFLGLRLLDGISKKQYYKMFSENIEDTYGYIIDKLVKKQLLENYNDKICLTNRGIDISNYVFRQFLLQ